MKVSNRWPLASSCWRSEDLKVGRAKMGHKKVPAILRRKKAHLVMWVRKVLCRTQSRSRVGRKISTSRCLGEKVAPQHEKTQARGQKSPRRALRNNQSSLSGMQTAYVRVCMCVCVRVPEGMVGTPLERQLGWEHESMGYLESPVQDFGLCCSSWKKWRGISSSLLLLRESHLHGFVPPCLLLPVLFPHKSVLSPRKKAWRADQLDGPLHTLWWNLWWVRSAGGL